MTIMPPKKMYQKLKIKGKRFIMRIGYLVAVSSGILLTQGTTIRCLHLPTHQANVGKEVGYADVITGVISVQNFHINGTKEKYYTMMFMTTYDTLDRSGNDRKRYINRETVQLKYPYIV